MKLLKTLLSLHFLSGVILVFCFPALYSSSIPPHEKNLYQLLFLSIPLIYILFPMNKLFKSSKIIYTKILASIIYLFIYFGNPIHNSWGILCIICLTVSILFLYLPHKTSRNIYLKPLFQFMLCMIFLGMSAFNMIIPSTIFTIRFIEAHQFYTSYVDIIPTVKYAITTQNGYDKKLAEHMPEKIFKQLNQKTQYPELNRFTAFELTELSQTQDKDEPRIIYVDTRSTISMENENNNHIFGGGQGYQQFTVLIENNTWYIVDYIEPISSDWRYK